MKNIRIIYTILVCFSIGVINTSCELVSANYGDINTSVFPSTTEDAKALVTSAAYSPLKNHGYGGIFNIANGVLVLSDEASDYGRCSNGGRDFIDYVYWANNPQWDWLIGDQRNYKFVSDISKMTLTIERISGIMMDEDLKQQYVAELRLARGWLAYLLYDFFGPIVIADLETLKNPNEEKILPRLTEEAMRSYIETELLEAVKVLPPNYKNGDSNYGRFTAGLGYTVLLKFYMHTKQWDKAKGVGLELLDSKYGYSLVPEYKDIFTLANERNSEIIWACQCAKGYQQHKWSAHVLTSDYDFTPVLDKLTKWSVYKITWDFVDTFSPDDKRLATIVTEYTSKSGKVHNKQNDKGVNGAILQYGAIPLKYELDPDCTGEDSQIDWIIYRFADVLTLTAEAIARSEGAVTAQAVELLNKVRVRSLPGKAYNTGDFASVDIFLSKILDERGWELYYEGTRRQDLIRHGKYIERMKEKSQKAGVHTLVDENRYIFPIPQKYIDEGKGIIIQNPGY